MKKLLAVLLAAMMIFSFATSALAAPVFPDLADQSADVQDAFAKLKALGILNGYEDGTAQPANSITRAEFAKIACIAAGLETSGDILKNATSQFSDVKSGEWYTGWINLATAKGYVKGYTDGTFKPNANITEQEVVTVLLRLLGYTDNLVGPWPIDYIAKAGQLDVLDGIKLAPTGAATRATVALMVSNLLDETVVSWNKDDEEFVEKDDTLLGSSFDSLTVDDVLFAYEGADLATSAWYFSGHDKDQINLLIEDILDDDVDYTSKLAASYAISDGLSLFDLAGQEADLILQYDDDEDDDFVAYINVTTHALYASKFTDIKSDSVKIDGTKYYYASGNMSGEFTDGDYTKVVLDKDDEIVGVYNIEDDNAAVTTVVKKVDTAAERIECFSGMGANLSLKNKDYKIYDLTGTEMALSDIEKYDTVYSMADESGLDYVLLVADQKSGVVDGADGSKISVAGKKYEVVGSAVYRVDGGDTAGDSLTPALLSTNDMFDKTAIYALNRSNQLAAVIFDAGNTTSNYVVVTDYDYSDTRDRATSVSVMNAAGEIATYDVDHSDGTVDNSDDSVIKLGALIKIRISEDGKIDKITAVGTKPVAGAEGDDSADLVKIDGSWYEIASDAALFNIKLDSDDFFDEAEVIAASDLYDAEDGITSTVANMQVVFDGGKIKALAITEFNGAATGSFGIVKSNAYYSGTKVYVLFNGFDSDDYKYEQGDFTGDDKLTAKALYEYDTTGSKLSDAILLFAPSNAEGEVLVPTYDEDTDLDEDDEADGYLDGELQNGKGMFVYGANGKVTDDSGLVVPEDGDLAAAAATLASVSATRIKVGDTYLSIDSDTEIYDYSKFSSEAPTKLTAADLYADMKVIVITSDDDDKSAQTSIAKFIIVVKK